MRNEGRRQKDGKCSIFISHCGDRCSFVSEIGRHLENMRFRCPSTPGDWLGHVWPNRRGAAGILILFISYQLAQDIGAANIF